MLVTEFLEQSLTSRQKEFAQSMFIESRLFQDLYKGVTREPANMQQAIDLFASYHDQLGNIIRTERPDLIELASQIEDTPDDLERISIWVGLYKVSGQ